MERPPVLSWARTHLPWPDDPEVLPNLINRTAPGCFTLAYDDGPHPVITPRLLKLLDEQKVKVLFFCTGKNAEKYPQLVRQIAQNGHELGLHGYKHVDFTLLNKAMMVSQLQRNLHVLQGILPGYSPRFFRPPYGYKNMQLIEAAATLDLKVMLWSYSSFDWYDCIPLPVLKMWLYGHNLDGRIALMHDAHYAQAKIYRKKTLELTLDAIRLARKQGLAVALPPKER